MVKEMKLNRRERRPLSKRALSVTLAGLLAVSVCGTPTIAYAAEDTDVLSEDARAERTQTDLSVAFATGDATVHCGGRTLAGQQAMTVSAEQDLTFVVIPREGFAIEEVSFQRLNEGVLDVLEPKGTAEGAWYTVAADRLGDGLAIVVDTAAVEPLETIEDGEVAPIDENPPVFDLFHDQTALTVTGRTPSVSVKDVEKIYDGQPVSVEASAVEEGATLMFYADGMIGWSTENPRFTDAGTYAVLVKAVSPGETEVEVVTAHVTVKPAPVTIEVRDAEKTAGSVDPVFEGVIEGLVPGDEIGSVVYYRLNSGVEEPGSYADVLSALVQHRNGNYAYTVTPGSFTIEAGPAAPAPTPVVESTALSEPSEADRSMPVNSILAMEFAQGEGMQRFTESVVKPIATLVGVVNADSVTIADDVAPLASFESSEQGSRLVPLLIIFGALVVAVGAGIVLIRRLRPAWFVADDPAEPCAQRVHLGDTGALPPLDAFRIR